MNLSDFNKEQQELLLACESPEEARALLLSGELLLSDELLDEIAGGAILDLTKLWNDIVERIQRLR